MSYNEYTNTLYLATKSKNSEIFYIINTSTKQIDQLQFGQGFSNFVLGNNKLYISTKYNSIIVYNLTKYEYIKTIYINNNSTNRNIMDIGFNSDHNQLMITSESSLFIIDGISDEITACINFGVDIYNYTPEEYSILINNKFNETRLQYIYYNALTDKIYLPVKKINVINDTYVTSSQLIILNGKTYSVIANIEDIGNDIVFNDDQKLIYAYQFYGDNSNGYGGKIAVLSSIDNQIVKIYDFYPFMALSKKSLSNNQFYAASVFSQKLYKLNENNMTLGEDVSNQHVLPFLIKDNLEYYCSSHFKLVVIDKITKNVIENVTINNYITALLYDDYSDRIFLLHGNGDTVGVIDLSNICYLSIKTNYNEDIPVLDGGIYEKGETTSIDNVTNTITKGSIRYNFKGWRINNSNVTNNILTIKMNTSYSLEAIYTKQYYLTVKSTYGNPIGEGWYDENTNATFSILSPEPEFWLKRIFTGWSGDSLNIQQNSTIFINDTKSVRANWTTDYTQSYEIAGGIILIMAFLYIVYKNKFKK